MTVFKKKDCIRVKEKIGTVRQPNFLKIEMTQKRWEVLKMGANNVEV